MHSYKSTQSGAALMIAMVLIFMISVMGISVMRNSTLEQRMASNSIQSSVVFQAAESVVEETLNNPDALTAAFNAIDANCDGTVVDWDVNLNGNNVDGLQIKSEIRFTRTSLAEGFSSDDFVALNYETRGGSEKPSARAESGIFRGASRVVPIAADC